MARVLVIEDDDTIREIVTEILEVQNYEVVCAANGRQGLRALQEASFDLVLCDVMMPDLNGHQVLAQLQTLPNGATTPFIFLTAKADKTDLRRGMELGADDYLTKPFTQQELLTAVTTRLEKQANVSQHYQQKLEFLRSSIAQALPHELLTPLSGVLGLSEILTIDCVNIDPIDLLDIAQEIHSSAKRLERVIQNTLLYAKLQIMVQDPQRELLALGESCQQVIVTIREAAETIAQASNRSADLVLRLEEATVRISDQDLQKIVEELVHNACKFSTAGTPIYVFSRVEADRFLLVVQDAGRGMTAEQITEVGAFSQFERKLYEQQGTGLGLAIVRLLVQLAGGTLHIESVPQQTRVQIELPT